ncbi:TetR family transcriptional regulator C-terminal domain-containing protein [Kitasatospora putterlickiae]|uniref:TetR family transcriptional regulator C-terminal domain-containing protein n=1 Tax=Kitasatospora putterlickiae TaxID=221725 RepID=A0ABN1XQ70_9ACTN
MPKVVIAENRRQDVARAVLRLVARDGLEHASLRNIADEAGLAIGSVRHYFDGQSEVVTFAMEELCARIGERVRRHAERLLNPAAPTGPADRRAAVEALLAELLPLDDVRREEAELWLAFTTAARTRPELRPGAALLHESTRHLIARVLDEARRAGGAPADLDVPLETERLAALLDGLALGMVLHPAGVPPRTALLILRRHLRDLAERPGPA